ncbi:MarR family transcriptional regulator, 2-MHQ and catechol-resistance regulon repressor [Tissierella praeacuta DSM 18095]|uniref:HTH-type transcriptional regulator MgrA n=1 Tax=Tissierella praeacuta DSM 18095 TaxID=1123404 RepID=A0A1M4XV19_9FIRM|nr:MarR family transcriptional regulator [Tissierella praeacuta]TCU79167.1 MarR family 2-MHQ and catechol resistance regulon transcriptional repressor [Tissierella praeacuta]SHE97265.1 MarR family transcriptional regulator, 2-MHQ and catechol-resistance regulon repressor [Tissierella praeacuta DSM 18095]SUO99212.1 Organic hydroperoxide resistance transcriptional regulator [Tissierella praeacuta]HAE91324.1 MarR family transcriptional regulator [Tissierella sp.]
MERLEKLSENYKWIERIASRTNIELLKTKDMLEEVHDRFFQSYDLSNTKFNVLVILYKGCTEEMYMSKIGERMLLSNANITGLIDRLEEQSLVKRVRSKEDRRKIVIKITEKGINSVEKVMEDYIKWSKKLMEVLTVEENNQLIKLLKTLQQGIIEIEKDNVLKIIEER